MSSPMDAWDEACRETNRADAAARRADKAEERAVKAEAECERLRSGGLRGLLDDAEIERDMLRAKLIKSIGMEAYTEWSEETPF